MLRNNQTVHQSPESLLTRATQFSDRMSYLIDAGMKPSSVLFSRFIHLSEMEFVERVSSSKPTDIATLKKFYQSLGGWKTIDELGRLLQLSPNQLMNAIYFLLISDLISISNSGVTPEAFAMEPKEIDVDAIRNVMMCLRCADSGMFIYPAFLYFLEQEYLRSYRAKSQFSVVVFEMRRLVEINGEVVRQALPAPALVDATLRLSRLKRHQDLLAHYDVSDYAFLLPSTTAGGASIFANRLVKCLTSSPLAGMEAGQLSVSVGSASIPDDFTDLGALLGAAESCMKRSRSIGQPVVMYKDVKHLLRCLGQPAAQ